VITLVTAHRHAEAGEAARESAALTTRPDRQASLLDMACSAFEQAAAFERAAAAAMALAGVLMEAGADPQQVAEQERRAPRYRSQLARLAQRSTAGPKPLDVVLLEMMSRAEKTSDADTMRHMAHLVCDVKVGLGAVAEAQWTEVLSEPWLRHRVMSDAVTALCRAERGREALELLQRYKSPGFAAFALGRLQAGPPPGPEAGAYLVALRALSDTVAVLRAPAQPECFADTERVRAAGEALLGRGRCCASATSSCWPAWAACCSRTTCSRLCPGTARWPSSTSSSALPARRGSSWSATLARCARSRSWATSPPPIPRRC
jgi:hypothetical protein